MHTLKVTISIFLILGIIILAGLISFHILDSSSRKIQNQLVEVEKNTAAGDWEKAKAALNSVNQNWEKTSKVWTALIDHIEIDNIDESLSKMEKYILVKDTSMALAELSTLKLFIKHIPDKESFNLENIL